MKHFGAVSGVRTLLIPEPYMNWRTSVVISGVTYFVVPIRVSQPNGTVCYLDQMEEFFSSPVNLDDGKVLRQLPEFRMLGKLDFYFKKNVITDLLILYCKVV